MLEIRCRQEDRSLVLELDGDICVMTVPVLSACLDALDETDAREVIVDVASVTLLTAQGIGVLIRTAHRRSRAGGSLTIRGATGLVARVLELTGAGDELCPPPRHAVLPLETAS